MILWLSLRHNRLRLYRWSAIFGGFALVQLLVQALNAVAGFLVVRTLGKPDYAWFTIASGMSATLSILADAGSMNAVTSIGGTVWQDKASLKGLLHAALRLRRKLAVLSSVIVGGISVWLLLRNGAGLSSALGLTGLVLAPIWQISTTNVLQVVNRLYSRTRQLQVADLVPALVRTSVTAGLALLGGLSPLTALVAILAAQFTQYAIVRRQVLPLLEDVKPSGIADHSARVRTVVRQLLPNCIFICIQGQLATWLISLFATTSEVSDLGALNRLAIIFSILSGPLGQFVIPSFARTSNRKRLWAMALALVAGTAAFGAVIVLCAWLHSEWFLWILGSKYVHLQRELMLVLAGMGLSCVAGFVWGLNIARGWIRLAWLNIPLTLAAQIVAACVLPLNSVMGLAWFIIATAAVQCCHALVTCIFGLTHDTRIQAPTPHPEY